MFSTHVSCNGADDLYRGRSKARDSDIHNEEIRLRPDAGGHTKIQDNGIDDGAANCGCMQTPPATYLGEAYTDAGVIGPSQITTHKEIRS